MCGKGGRGKRAGEEGHLHKDEIERLEDLLVVDTRSGLQREVGVRCVRKNTHDIQTHPRRLFQRLSHECHSFPTPCAAREGRGLLSLRRREVGITPLFKLVKESCYIWPQNDAKT